MTRYIDADNIDDSDLISGKEQMHFRALIAKQPTADVQPVVHCKDCIHRHKPDDCVCPMCSTDMDDNVFDLTEDDNFCKYGNNGAEHDNG